VSHCRYLLTGDDRTGPPCRWEKSRSKQDAQLCHRSACSPVRSVTSSTEVQKQVGQASVQFPQVRQRDATSSQRDGRHQLRAVRLAYLRHRRHPLILRPGPHADPRQWCRGRDQGPSLRARPGKGPLHAGHWTLTARRSACCDDDDERDPTRNGRENTGQPPVTPRRIRSAISRTGPSRQPGDWPLRSGQSPGLCQSLVPLASDGFAEDVGGQVSTSAQSGPSTAKACHCGALRP